MKEAGKSSATVVWGKLVAVRTGAFTLWLCFLLVAVARADAVLLLEQPALRPGLCAALRIQLTGAAEVRCEAEPSAGSIADRIERGGERVRSTQSRLGVLLERDPDPGRVRMYLLSAQKDQAVIAIEAIEDRPEPDIDRGLALKVADAFEIVEVVQRAIPEATRSPLLATLAIKPAVAADDTGALNEAATATWSGFVEAGAGLRAASGLHALGKFMLGAGWRRPLLDVEAAAGLTLASERTEENAAGQVALKERGPFVSLRVLSRHSRWAAGGALEAGLSFIAAQGTTNDGARGERTVTSPTLSLALDARFRVFDYLWLRLAPALEVLPMDRSFGVDGTEVVNDGFLRGGATLSLVIDFPVRRVESVQP
jgi:hypothetical protein